MYVPPSFIKNIALQIRPDYKLDNAPFAIADRAGQSVPFIGRKQLQEKFLEFLHGNSKKGVFLVTGYRGMGKTSFVNHVLNRYKTFNLDKTPRKINKKKSIIPIHLTLAQNKPKELDILKLMVNSVHDLYEGYRYNSITSLLHAPAKAKFYFVKIMLATSLVITAWSILRHSVSFHRDFAFVMAPQWDWVKSTAGFAAQYLSVVPLIIFSCAFVFFKLRVFVERHKPGPINRIKRLLEICYASSSEENSSNEEYTLPYFRAKLGSGEKRTKQYPIAEGKQIEYELQQFLEETHKEIEFIFIFDELDKVEPAISTSYLYEDLESFENKKIENAYERDLRDRKQAIINIIAGLKNFFTTAKARFVFIAGREMFDASLADIADRQSSISSIFTYVFNIESMLKETELKDENHKDDKNSSSLSNAIEAYLKNVLFDAHLSSPLYETAKAVYGKENYDKVFFTLQNFITYLTYRSNGSPQKLIKAIHEFISVKQSFQGEETKTILCLQNSKKPSKLYLSFNYRDQYRIGFVSYLYRPFLIKYGRSFKLYSDNIILSTPYLFDHLIKFHPFAFSLSNLELIPEVLSTNKTPYLRSHLKQIIDHLGHNHIRETEISLFDYKFYSRTKNELAFLSKIYEQEAAAFNFTLDESYLVKLHVRNKIKELRSIYSKFLGNSEASRQQIFSIAHCNGLLGDLHFFDQEYDDAIVAYSDAIKPIAQLNIEDMDMQDFITLIKNKLKLGLCYEKINSYQEALAFYTDSSQDAKQFMENRLLNGRAFNVQARWVNNRKKTTETVGTTKTIYYSSALPDVLQIILQCFLSKIFLQEKMGVDGISDLKLSIAIGGFFKITAAFLNHRYRNHLVKSNIYLFTGKLLYFKNTQAGFDPDKINEREEILPTEVFKKIHQIAEYYRPDSGGNSAYVFQRMPTMALAMYLLSIFEVLSSKHFSPADDLTTKFTSDKFDFNNENLIRKLIDELTGYLNSKDEQFRGVHFRYIASILSNIGDCLLGMYRLKNEDQYNKFEIHQLFDIEKLGVKTDRKSDTDFVYCFSTLSAASHDSTNEVGNFDLTDILKCYYVSGLYFLKYGRTISCSFQYNKILNILRSVMHTNSNNPDILIRKKFLETIQLFIVKPLLQIAGQNTGHGDIHMLKKAREYEVNMPYALNNISNHPETKEAILLFNYLKIKLKHYQHLNVEKFLISTSNSYSTQYARLMELDFYGKYVYERYLSSGRSFPALIDIKKDIEFDNNATNYLYSRLTILRTLEIYNTDYSLGHRYFAYTHYHVARFLRDCLIQGKNISVSDNIKSRLDDLLGKGSYSSLEPIYHFKKAKEYYEKTIRLHTAGTDYRKMISDMVYLEDDFNDNAYHFGAALDRYFLINGVMAKRIESCDIEINAEHGFSDDAYLIGDWPK